MSHSDDSSTHDPPPSPHSPPHPRYRAPIGMPQRDEGRRMGAVVSIVVHALVIGLLIIPFVMPHSVIERMRQGAGGAGPAGGGGGGRGGTGSETRETLRFVRIAPEPVPATKTVTPAPIPTPPKIEPPKPAVTPPVQEQQQQPAAPVPGANGGSGHDGSAGAGPGSGGGVGSGIGTGHGSAAGPGTGGGTQTNFQPEPKMVFLPPLPAPGDVRGVKFTAEFDVDSTGRVLDIKFTETPNRDYNQKLYAVLRAIRFRPGTRPDGTPIRMRATLGWDF